MQRRKLLFFGPVVPIAFFLSRHLKTVESKSQRPADPRQQAAELNQLASSIKTPSDAQEFVDFVASIFAEDLLPAWGTTKVRERIASAEFDAVSDRRKLVPEGQLTHAWNGFVKEIGAAPDTQVTDAEVHNLRDAFFSSASYFWRNGNKTIWTAPGIYAINDRGEIADGCRAVESVRILWDLANMPTNLIAARERVRQNVLASDQFAKTQEAAKPLQGSVSFAIAETNPIEIAARKFIADNGTRSFSKAVSTMLDQTFV